MDDGALPSKRSAGNNGVCIRNGSTIQDKVQFLDFVQERFAFLGSGGRGVSASVGRSPRPWEWRGAVEEEGQHCVRRRNGIGRQVFETHYHRSIPQDGELLRQGEV